MWVTKFKLRDDNDIYSPLCERLRVEFRAFPYTSFVKAGKINLVLGGIVSGNEETKKKFIDGLKQEKRVKTIEQYHDFILIHALHSISKEAKTEIRIFYNPQYIMIKPIHIASDGWEYWEVACFDKAELKKIIDAAKKHYHGELFSLKEEKIKSIASFEFSPSLTEKQFEALQIAYERGYYNYPRKLTIPELAKVTKKSYSAFQENLRKAENKLIDYFLKYR